MQLDWYEEIVPLPRAARFPVELRPPRGFRPTEAATWPRVEGRLEYVGGKLLYMPPCGDLQQDVVPAVVSVLYRWGRAHRELVVAGNEAGMILGREVRAADAAVWRRASLGPYKGEYRRVPPILAVEVAGLDEDEAHLVRKARWYLKHGVKVAWLVLPESREVVVIRRARRARIRLGQRIPSHPDLPQLQPLVDEFFEQLR